MNLYMHKWIYANFDLFSTDVSTVSPNIGSRMGGQTITITGKYFTNAIARTSVTVGGIIILGSS